MAKIDLTVINPKWHLCGQFSIDAAALIAGYDPGLVAFFRADPGFTYELELPDLDPVLTALANAIATKKLKATIVVHKKAGRRAHSFSETLIEREDLVRWLEKRVPRADFFFSHQADDGMSFMDPNHPRYAPRLHAAVLAWRETTYVPAQSTQVECPEPRSDGLRL